MDSHSDERVNNNTMRHQYRQLSEAEKEQMQTVKDKGQDLLLYIDSIAESREISIAKTKVEEAVMWAVKDITG